MGMPVEQTGSVELSQELLLDGARYGDLEDVEIALSSSTACSIDAVDASGRTALHMACANGHEEIVEFLLSKGARVDVANQDGNTPLHWAALNGHLNVVNRLLQAGASPTALNRAEKTPMDEAMSRGFEPVMTAMNTWLMSHDAASLSTAEGPWEGEEGGDQPSTSEQGEEEMAEQS